MRTTVDSHRIRTGLLIGAASLVLGIGTTAALAAAGVVAEPGSGPVSFDEPRTQSCVPPALPGSIVDVTVSDMGAMMGGPMMGRPSRRHGWEDRDRPVMGMMRVIATPVSVPAGEVSLRVANIGMLDHEVVVLPLPSGQGAGERSVDADGEVDEATSVGEAARTCGAGDGEGIEPGAFGWTTLTLAPGRYELLCNLPGHYSAGMYTELDVTAPR